MNLRERRKVRPSFRVLVMTPKLGSVSVMPGSANCGVFERLMDSMRKAMSQSLKRVH